MECRTPGRPKAGDAPWGQEQSDWGALSALRVNHTGERAARP